MEIIKETTDGEKYVYLPMYSAEYKGLKQIDVQSFCSDNIDKRVLCSVLHRNGFDVASDGIILCMKESNYGKELENKKTSVGITRNKRLYHQPIKEYVIDFEAYPPYETIVPATDNAVDIDIEDNCNAKNKRKLHYAYLSYLFGKHIRETVYMEYRDMWLSAKHVYLLYAFFEKYGYPLHIWKQKERKEYKDNFILFEGKGYKIVVSPTHKLPANAVYQMQGSLYVGNYAKDAENFFAPRALEKPIDFFTE